MSGVHFGIDTQQVGQIWGLDEAFVQHLLSEVIEFVRDDSPLHSPIIVSIFSNNSVDHLGVPPDTSV